MRHNGKWVYGLAAISALGLGACSGESGDGDDVGGTLGGASGTSVGVGGAAVGQGGQTVGQGGAVTSVGGSSTTTVAGTTTPSGGATSVGGTTSTGGSSAKGGTTSTGGSSAKGGTTSTGGSSAKGGTTSTGGSSAKGGTTSTGGSSAKGGTTSTGGSSAKGGTASTGGTTTAIGGAASCTDTAWNPPASANGNTGIPAGLDKEWARSGATIVAARNIKTRQIIENGGKMRYCARWDSNTAISKTQRQQVAALMAKCDQQWASQLTGWGCWPYSTIDTKITMWVVKSATVLTDWTAAEGAYVVSTDPDVACPASCAQEPGTTQKTSCNGGAIYDEFLWLDGDKTDYTGWGSATGFYMSLSSYMSAASSNAATETIVAHELGHAHGLNDFYTADVVPAGWTSFVMQAGSSSVVTTTDGWMLRDVWRHIRSSYGYPRGQ